MVSDAPYILIYRYRKELSMKLIMLGTGNANVTECYNTCFIFDKGSESDSVSTSCGSASDLSASTDCGRYFLVDAGGGNGIFGQLKKAGIRLNDIHLFFCTHKHLDHFAGMLWLVRMLLQEISKGNYAGNAEIFGHEEVTELLDSFSRLLLPEKLTKYIGSRLLFTTVSDGEHRNILGNDTVFFDIESTKARQFGFSMQLDDAGSRLTCCGDEPYRECEAQYVKNCTWLLHEAFCLYSERELFKPYEKHHSTVKDACGLAESMNVKNLLLYHTEDKNIENRKELYTKEGRSCYSGTLYVPEDLEVFELSEK